MSCYIVEENHIAYLLRSAWLLQRNEYAGSDFTWYVDGVQKSLTNFSEVGQMLWDANIKATTTRYDDCDLDELPGPNVGWPYIFKMPSPMDVAWGIPDPLQIIKACRCYAYQCDEYDEWKTSEANMFIETLQSMAINALPGYGEKEWGAPEPIPARVSKV
jgi:hypothetical protein